MFRFIAHFIYLVLKDIVKYLEPEEVLPELELTDLETDGIGESIRCTLDYAEVEYTDTRLTTEQLHDIKTDLLYEQLPMLTINDMDDVVQSKAILRYVGRITRTYPSKNPLFAALIDQWMELHSDFWMPINMNLYPESYGLDWNGSVISSSPKKSHTEWIIKTHVPKYLNFLNVNLEKSQWLGEMDEPSIADFSWWPTLKWISSGKFEGLDTNVIDEYEYVKLYMAQCEASFAEYD